MHARRPRAAGNCIRLISITPETEREAGEALPPVAPFCVLRSAVLQFCPLPPSLLPCCRPVLAALAPVLGGNPGASSLRIGALPAPSSCVGFAAALPIATVQFGRRSALEGVDGASTRVRWIPPSMSSIHFPGLHVLGPLPIALDAGGGSSSHGVDNHHELRQAAHLVDPTSLPLSLQLRARCFRRAIVRPACRPYRHERTAPRRSH